MPTLTPEGADLQRAVAEGTAAVDAVFQRFWERIITILAPYGDRPLTDADRLAIRQAVSRELAALYGPSRALVRAGAVHPAIVSAMTSSANLPALRMLRDLETLVSEQVGRSAWQRVRTNMIAAGIARNDPLGRIVAQVDLNGPVTRQQRLLRSSLLDPERRWVPRDTWTTKRGYTLSDRVWKQGRDTRRAIDRRLRLAVREGTSAVDLALDLERYLKPGLRPLRDMAGQLVAPSLQAPGVVTRTPWERFGPNLRGGVQRAHYIEGLRDGGFGSYPALRLARTEITRVHGAATIEAAKVTPGLLGVRWRLSASHPERDRCDSHASGHTDGLPAGVYAVDAVPLYPDHPHCLCVLIREMKSRDEVLDELFARYGAGMEGVAA